MNEGKLYFSYLIKKINSLHKNFINVLCVYNTSSSEIYATIGTRMKGWN